MLYRCCSKIDSLLNILIFLQPHKVIFQAYCCPFCWYLAPLGLFEASWMLHFHSRLVEFLAGSWLNRCGFHIFLFFCIFPADSRGLPLYSRQIGHKSPVIKLVNKFFYWIFIGAYSCSFRARIHQPSNPGDGRRVLKTVFSSFSYMLSDVLISSDMGWKLEILRIKSDYVRRFGFFFFSV